MKALVCGGRKYGYKPEELALIHRTLEAAVERLGLTSIVQGGADGADRFAAEWCWDRSIPVGTFNAKWKEHGKAAGPIRNQEMIDQAKPDYVLAFPGGDGTADMVSRARKAGLTVYEIGKSPKGTQG